MNVPGGRSRAELKVRVNPVHLFGLVSGGVVGALLAGVAFHPAAAVAVMLGVSAAAWTLIHQRVILEDGRVGLSGVLGMETFVNVGDVVHVAPWTASTAKGGIQHGIVLFAMHGGHRPGAGWFVRRVISVDDRAAVAAHEAHTGDRLRVLSIPAGNLSTRDTKSLMMLLRWAGRPPSERQISGQRTQH